MDNFDFGELKNDANLISKVKAVDDGKFHWNLIKTSRKLENFFSAIQKIEDMLSLANQINYEELSVEEKVKYDIFLSYSINSLYFMYLKINGEDPNNVSSKFLDLSWRSTYFLWFILSARYQKRVG